MARDYKHRALRPRQRRREPQTVRWKWPLAALLVLVLFTGFLLFLRGAAPPDEPVSKKQTIEVPPAVSPSPAAAGTGKKPATDAAPATEEEKETTPRFDFYTILPEKEVVIPEHEIKTRKREETLGKAASHSYTLQAGSFRNLKDADRRKAELALLGIEARIETALVNGKQWNRVKIGPVSGMNRVDTIRARLRDNRIDVVVLNNKE